MELDFKKYAQYGMDRFGATIELRQGEEGEEGVIIKTHPIRNEDLENQLLDHFPSALIDGATSATIVVMSDGTLMAQSVANRHHTAIKSVLLEGRDAMFQKLENLESEHMLKKFADSAARDILLFGKKLDFENIDVKCPNCGSLQVAAEQLMALFSEEETPKQVSVPGAYCNLPNDFQADFNAGLPARFRELVVEELREMLPRTEKLAEDLPANIDKARRLIEE